VELRPDELVHSFLALAQILNPSPVELGLLLRRKECKKIFREIQERHRDPLIEPHLSEAATVSPRIGINKSNSQCGVGTRTPRLLARLAIAAREEFLLI